jgi:integrase
VLDNVVLPQVGQLRLREATTGRMEIFIVGLRSKSPSRQRKAKVVLGAMFDLAVRHDALPVNPIRQTGRLHRPKKEVRTLTLEDIAAIRRAVQKWTTREGPGPSHGSDLADMIEVMLGTGARIGEVLALRWSDVDLTAERPTLTITGTIKTERGRGTYRKDSPKSDSSRRTVALPAFAVAVLERRLRTQTPNAIDAVFATRNGTWHQVSNVSRRWGEVRKDTELDWVTPHTFRRTVATLISERVSSETASQQLGHSSPEITRDITSPSRPSLPMWPTCSKNSRQARHPRTTRPVRADLDRMCAVSLAHLTVCQRGWGTVVDNKL